MAGVLSITIGPSAGSIENTVKGQSAKTYQGGLAEGGEIVVNARFDRTDACQLATLNGIFGGFPTASAFIVVLDTDSGYGLSGSCFPINKSITSPEGDDLVSATYTYKVTSSFSP